MPVWLIILLCLGCSGLAFIWGFCILGPAMDGLKPFTTPWQAVHEPEKHRLDKDVPSYFEHKRRL